MDTANQSQYCDRRLRRLLNQPLWFYVPILLILVTSSSATVYVVSEISNETVIAVNDMPARFIPERYAFYGMQGYLVYADPPTACTKVKPPPTPYAPSLDYPISWILLAKRSPDCHFQTKIENAQISGYSAIIIHNVGSNDTEVMGVEDPGKLMIYATFIGEYDGWMLKNYTFPSPFFLRIRNEFSVNSYLLPFAVIVGICIIVMLLFMVRLLWQQVVRWLRERRRSRRRKLPASALKKLPIHKWTKGDPYETCAVCLDDFVEQEKIRILPCYHGYHIQCIDHWLTKGRRVCPICKRKVIVADERFSDSDTETEDENAPLIPTTSTSQNPPSGASTFIQNHINVRVIGIGSRRLLTRNRQNPVNDSDASSISSGLSHSAADDQERGLTHSTTSTRPSTSAGRNSHSQSVFAEVHQSTEMLRKKLESQKQKKPDQSASSSGDCVQDSHEAGLDNSAYALECSSRDNDRDSNSVLDDAHNASVVPSEQLVVVVDECNSDGPAESNQDETDHSAVA
ncbi:E3 ubiquitin-protein ligase RNF13 [Orchesella cincta]|uniref:E3 ubiquitin-protein ligase RNF13 n=1 Tax=Orchesella cincta TaxID=48709 RepID=A0A1D2NE22_ORCCI|nr:E3 ubiquitin-protein ligase RNF13 [Orchesella cincta]